MRLASPDTLFASGERVWGLTFTSDWAPEFERLERCDNRGDRDIVSP